MEDSAARAAAQTEALFAEKGVHLTEAQRRGLELSGRPTLLLAVPGSGKTTVLVGRVAALLLSGVPAERILSLTFSRESARDMTRRFSALFPGLPLPRFSTIHSLCYSILTDYSRCSGRPVPPMVGADGQPTALQLLREVIRQQTKEFVEEEDLNDALSAIGLCKNLMLTRQEMGDVPCALEDLPGLFDGYQQRKASLGLMDYDDILLYALTFLQKLPALLQRWRQRYDFINVDESQDVSRVQLELLRLLKPDGSGLFLVGDEDQSIYGFRGAYPQGMLSFQKLFPEGQVCKMEDNFRSRPGILSRCGSFIRLNRDRYEKELVPGRRENGEPCRLLRPRTPEQLCEQLLQKIASLKEDETLGILYRNNLSALPLADLLLEAAVPFSATACPSLLIRYHIRTLCDLLRLAEDPMNFDLFRMLKPAFDLDTAAKEEVLRREGKGSVPALLQQTGEELKLPHAAKLGEVLDRIRGMSPGSALSLIEKELRFGRFLLAKALSAEDANAAFRSSLFRQFCRRCRTIPQLFQRIDRAQQLLTAPVRSEEGRVFLSTIHSAKGLEFDHVFLLDCCDGILPGRTSLEQLAEQRNAAFYEEVRLFYVAATRARETLTLCAPAQSERGLLPSRFLDAFLHPDPPKKQPAPGAPLHLTPGQAVLHKTLGRGIVQSLDGDLLRVAFAPTADGKQNLKTLSLSFCTARKLLQKVE
ncbi:MAG: ATP-dependent helicase [Oscillospiraceae bacterium]|nr:ATP-dependent helicase [Oscillospiraceae bacterium]